MDKKNELYDPPPPADLVGAKHDTVHKTMGKGRAGNAVAIDRLEAERDRWKVTHKKYYDGIGEALKDVREYRYTGEPAKGDCVEIEELIAERDKLKAQVSFVVKELPGDWCPPHMGANCTISSTDEICEGCIMRWLNREDKQWQK